MTSVTVVGPGAIGCTVAGALLQRGDVDLVLAARTPFSRLRVEWADPHDGEPAVDEPVAVLTDPAAVPAPVDVVLLATKTHQTADAAPWLEALCGRRTVVAVLQNGIGHHALVDPLAGPATVVPTIVFLPADRLGPGHVRAGRPAALRVPDDRGGRRVVDLFAGSWVDVHGDVDFHTTAWSKLVSNCAVGAVTTLTRTSNRVLEDPEAREIAEAVLRETVAVAIADGAALPTALADGIVDIVLDRAADHVSSQTTDRRAGVATEWEARQLEVIHRAERHGVDVPTLRMLTTLIRLGEPDAVTRPTTPA